MNAFEARQDLAMVESILKRTDVSVDVPPLLMGATGGFGFLVNALHQASCMGLRVPRDQIIHLPLLLIAVSVSVWTVRRRRAERRTLAERQAAILFTSVVSIAFLLSVAAGDRFISISGLAMIWAGAFMLILLFLGIDGSNYLFIGGCLMAAAIVLGCIFPAWLAGFLAAGYFAGLILPSALMTLRHS